MHYSLKNKKYLILSISAIILIWQGVAVSFNNRLLLPSFWDVLIEIYKIIKNKEFFKLIFSSSFRCIQSFILSIIISIVLVITSYFSKVVYNILYPIITFMKAVPTMAFIVLLLIWTSKDLSPIIIGILISLPIFYDEMLNSLFNIDEGLLKMIKIYRISKLDKIKVIVIPVIYMEIKKIMSSTISLIFKVVISSEVYAQPQYGIGSIIQFEKLQLNTAAIIGWMIIITLIICFIDFITTKLIRGERENANINFKYGSNEIYNNFNIEFQQGKVNCIIGESGCGKTTLLNYISEKLYYENKRIAYVFQEDNLIPWKNIYVNLKIVAKKYFEKSILEKEINNALVKVRLEKYKYFYPRELSGGMRQRINFARALIGNPEVILMDEPFKSLDIKSKNNMIELIKNLKNTDITIILVTHDINEILMLADVVYYLGGRPVEIIESAIGINIKNIIKKINKPIDDLE